MLEPLPQLTELHKLLPADSNTSQLKEALLKCNKLNISTRSLSKEQLLNTTMLKPLNIFLMKKNSLTTRQLNTSPNKFLTLTKNLILITFLKKKLSKESDSTKSKDQLLTQLLPEAKLKLFTQLLMPSRALPLLLDKSQLKFQLPKLKPQLLSSDHL